MDLKDIVLTIRLTPGQVNLILSKLGACPYAEVAELITLLKSQGDAGVEQARLAEQGVQANGLGEARS